MEFSEFIEHPLFENADLVGETFIPFWFSGVIQVKPKSADRSTTLLESSITSISTMGLKQCKNLFLETVFIVVGDFGGKKKKKNG